MRESSREYDWLDVVDGGDTLNDLPCWDCW
jgi:hypothetical protein